MALLGEPFGGHLHVQPVTVQPAQSPLPPTTRFWQAGLGVSAPAVTSGVTRCTCSFFLFGQAR